MSVRFLILYLALGLLAAGGCAKVKAMYEDKRYEVKVRTNVEQAADFFHAVGEATHNRVFMVAHEPLVQLLVPTLAAMIDKVPQARGRIADAQKRLVAAIRAGNATQAEEWMAKHIRDFRRGFEIARIALERRVATA